MWKGLKGLFVVDEHGAPIAASDPDLNVGDLGSSDDVEALLARVRATTKGAPPPEPAASVEGDTPPPPPDSTPIQEGRPFEDIYSDGGVPTAAYKAEQLLKVLEGLRAMDVATRKTVVEALDAADDKWVISDPVNDAKAKIGALMSARRQIAANLTAAEQQAATDQAAQDAYLAEASAKIKEQIEELNALLQEEVRATTQHKAEITARLDAARKAATRESARLETEAARLGEIPTIFDTPTTTPK